MLSSHAVASPQYNSDTGPDELFVFRTGRQLFAVRASEVAGTAERKVPAKLPLAPAAVLGVISVRGRVLTVLDPLAFVNEQQPEARAIIPFVVILKGDEQLALAADRREDSIQVSPDRIRPTSEASVTARSSEQLDSPILGSVQNNDATTIIVLDPAKLFAAAMGKLERRRRRT